MAISPPSDIVLDVAAAADPEKVRAAVQRLAKVAGDPSATEASFDELLPTSPAPISPAPAGDLGLAEARYSFGVSKDPSKVYQKFEAVLLQSFVESMLPKSAELFGDKSSADVYRSMMAEQLANQIAKTGSLGIAKHVLGAHPPGRVANASTQADS